MKGESTPPTIPHPSLDHLKEELSDVERKAVLERVDGFYDSFTSSCTLSMIKENEEPNLQRIPGTFGGHS